MWYDENMQLWKFLLRHVRFYTVEQFHSRLVRIGSKWLLFVWSEKSFLSFKLFTTDPQEKPCLPVWFTILQMIIEEIFKPTTFVWEWKSAAYCKMSDFFFWVIFLGSSSSSLTPMRSPNSSSMNTSLGESLKVSNITHINTI